MRWFGTEYFLKPKNYWFNQIWRRLWWWFRKSSALEFIAAERNEQEAVRKRQVEAERKLAAEREEKPREREYELKQLELQSKLKNSNAGSLESTRN